MTKKQELLEEFDEDYSHTKLSVAGGRQIIELLADIRDEQVSLNKTLSAVLAGLLMPAQQGTPVKGEEISGAEAYGTPYTGGKKDEK